MKTPTICFAFLTLVAIGAAGQDTVCTTFVTETVACNGQPYTGCSSHASVDGVVVDGTGAFGCMHLAPQLFVLTCPGGQSWPGNQVVQVQATNPYCEQTYTECGCLDCGDGGAASEGAGGPASATELHRCAPPTCAI